MRDEGVFFFADEAFSHSSSIDKFIAAIRSTLRYSVCGELRRLCNILCFNVAQNHLSERGGLSSFFSAPARI
jgi:hypothetical protein